MTREQATMREWDEGRGGSAYRDDGSVVFVPLEALQDSVFRFLRAGQRVSLVLEGEHVAHVDLV